MAKLLIFTLALAALVALATAHTTIVTTSIQDENAFLYPTQQLEVCQQYLQQSIQSSPYKNYEPSQSLQQLCCNQLQNIDQQFQCEAVKQAFQGALQQEQQQQGSGRFGAQQMGQLMQKAQQLPNQCNLQLKGQCQIGSIVQTVITTTVTNDDRRQYSRKGGSSGGSQQQCSEVQGRQFSQCQRYIQQQQQQQSGSVLLMRINRQGQQQPQELRSCCNELENVQRECQCVAIQEVYEQALRQQQQQQGGRKQSGYKNGVESQTVQKAIQSLKNECNLQVQQCNIPSSMF